MKNLAKSLIGSWETTLAAVVGVAALALSHLAGVEVPNFENWGEVVAMLAALIGVGLAKDGDKKSEGVGLK